MKNRYGRKRHKNKNAGIFQREDGLKIAGLQYASKQLEAFEKLNREMLTSKRRGS